MTSCISPAREPDAIYQVKTGGAVIPKPQPPSRPWPSVVGRSRQDRRFSMKHQIITTDLRTDLMVTTIAVGALAAFSAIGFMFTLVIAI